MTSFHRFYVNQSGSFILSSTITIIALTVLIGYLANMGAETIEREKLQRAADAAAYSSAVVLARGMNTICSFEHVIGELTAYCVLFEALVGPDKDFSPCKEEKEMNNILKMCRSKSPHPDYPADRNFVQELVDQLVDHDKHEAGAACYDAELTLKYYMLVCLSLKAKANIAFYIPSKLPIVGPFFTALLLAFHATADGALVYLGIEYTIVRGYETALSAVAPVVQIPLRTIKIPLLENQLHNVVGNSSYDPNQPIVGAIQKVEDKMRSHYDLQSVVSVPRDTFLPLSALGTNLSIPILPRYPLFCESKPTKLDGSNYLSKLDSEPWTSGTSNPYNSLPKLPWTGTDKGGVRQTLMDVVEILESSLSFFIPMISRYKPDRYGYRNNPSVWSYPVKTFDMDVEQRTQWVRASYPVVDSLRSGLRLNLSNYIPLSNMSTYLTAWSYRYTLSESYYFRSGDERPYSTASLPRIPLSLPTIAMSGLDDKGKDVKGNELWTTPVVGSPIIDDMFSVTVAVEAKPKSPFISGLFSRTGQDRGNVVFAQAMYYNASGRAAHFPMGNLISKSNNTQPDTGWDTLQWKPKDHRIQPTLTAPEWWNGKPSKGPKSWTVFGLLGSTSTVDSARIYLNWQAMLVPISKRRLERFENKDIDENIRRAARHAAENHSLMSH